MKALLLGDSATGKTCLREAWAGNKYTNNTQTTIGVEFLMKKHYVKKDNITQTVTIQIWDTAGQERFKTITAGYYRGANYIFIVYAINKIQSFKNIKVWIKEAIGHGTKAKFILVGSKSDLGLERQVDNNVVEKFMKDMEKIVTFIGHIEVSAKEGTNIDESLKIMTDNIDEQISVLKNNAHHSILDQGASMELDVDEEGDDDEDSNGIIRIESITRTKSNKCGC